jgi:DNA-binding response OmpR family regulator
MTEQTTNSQPDPNAQAASDQPPQPKRVAVIDDSSPFRMLVKQILETSRYKVDLFSSGEDLLSWKNNSPENYDLFICDVYLPGLNGMNIVETLRNHPLSRSTPILLVTGEPSIEVITLSRKFMVNDFIGKPIDPVVFMQRVKKLLFPPAKKLNA